MVRVLEQRWGWRRSPLGASVLFAGQGLALLAVYDLNVNIIPTVLAALTFAVLALLRPDLALLYIPLAMPMTWRAKGIWDAHFGVAGKFFPLHELVVIILVAVTLLHVISADGERDALPRRAAAVGPAALLRQAAPLLLFLAAAVVGVLIALPEGRAEALRQLRRVIVEPLLVYLLVRYWGRQARTRLALVAALVASGAAVAAVGGLQLAGIDLAPTDGVPPCHSPSVASVGGVLRVTSVYCHPNNLGLYLGRIWPLGAALAWEAAHGWQRKASCLAWLGWVTGSALALFGLLLSFSKGALLGALLALVVLISFARNRRGLLLLVGALMFGLALAVFGGPERLNPLGDSSSLRLSVYESSLRMLRDHPLLGIGLGQFFYYYNPEFGHDYISPEALAANEQYTAHPHNLLLDLLLQLGPLGLLAFVWLTLRLLRHCISGWRVGREPYLLLGIGAATSAGLAHGLVDQGYFFPDLAIFFWLSLGLAETAIADSPADAGPSLAKS